MIIAGASQAERKRKSSLHLLLHSSWTDDMLRLAISARKVYRLIYITAPHSWMGSKSKEEAWIWLRYVREIDVMKCPTALWCESSVLLQASVMSSSAKRSVQSVGLNWEQGNFGPRRWFIFAGTCSFLGTTRQLLVLHFRSLAQPQSVRYSIRGFLPSGDGSTPT